MSKKKVITIAVSVVLVAAVATLIVTNVAGGKKEEVVAEVPPVVAAENPELRTIEVSTELIGTIEPDSIVYVTPKGAGEIISVNVQTGDQVTAGQLLCEIDTKQVEAARLTMETARVSYEDAKSNLDRYSVLLSLIHIYLSQGKRGGNTDRKKLIWQQPKRASPQRRGSF